MRVLGSYLIDDRKYLPAGLELLGVEDKPGRHINIDYFPASSEREIDLDGTSDGLEVPENGTLLVGFGDKIDSLQAGVVKITCEETNEEQEYMVIDVMQLKSDLSSTQKDLEQVQAERDVLLEANKSLTEQLTTNSKSLEQALNTYQELVERIKTGAFAKQKTGDKIKVWKEKKMKDENSFVGKVFRNRAENGKTKPSTKPKEQKSKNKGRKAPSRRLTV